MHFGLKDECGLPNWAYVMCIKETKNQHRRAPYSQVYADGALRRHTPQHCHKKVGKRVGRSISC